MCDRTHRYTVEVPGQPARYTGTDESAAVAALLSTGTGSDTGEEGCVTAEHEDGSTCPPEGDRVADAADAALAERDAQAVKLTRAEAAYAHLASFQRGDLVDVGGRAFFMPGTVTMVQQEAAGSMERAWLIVEGCGVSTAVSVASLLNGRHTITSRADAKAGNVRYFDAAGYATQNAEA